MVEKGNVDKRYNLVFNIKWGLMLRFKPAFSLSSFTFIEKFFPSRARMRKRVSSGCGRDSRASSRVETGMSGNFLSCSKGVKDPLEVPEVRCD